MALFLFTSLLDVTENIILERKWIAVVYATVMVLPAYYVLSNSRNLSAITHTVSVYEVSLPNFEGNSDNYMILILKYDGLSNICAKKMSIWNDLDKERTLVLCMDKLIIRKVN